MRFLAGVARPDVLSKRTLDQRVAYLDVSAPTVCHAILTDIKFLKQLVKIDQDLADQTRFQGCRCGGALHQAHFPRKPRSCPSEVRDEFAKRFSFCCAQCRRRMTAVSVRFLGRRVHLALAVVLLSERGPTPASASRLAQQLAVSPRTVARWRQWWRDSFPSRRAWCRCQPSKETYLSSIPATPKRDRWAHLRFSIVGPLLAAPPQPGQLYGAIRDLAAKTWRYPVSGTDVRFATATIERWFYAARNASDPVSRLRDRRRGDRGTRTGLAKYYGK